MKYRKKPLLILGASILGLAVAFILTSPSYLGICPMEDKYCLDPFDEIVGQPLGIISICLFVISLALLFTKHQIFTTWSKFAMIFLPIATVLVAITPTIGGAIIDFDKESLALFLSGVFLIASLAIITVKSLKLRRKEK